jgi:hypothetical protein
VGRALQETFDAGLKLLPRFSVVHLMRLALRATATAAMRAFGPDGVKGFNLFAVEKLAINVATIERFAGRCVHAAMSGGEGSGVRGSRLRCAELKLGICNACMSNA